MKLDCVPLLKQVFVTVLIAALVSSSTFVTVLSIALNQGTSGTANALDHGQNAFTSYESSLSESSSIRQFSWQSFLRLFPSDKVARAEWLKNRGATICADEDSAELIFGVDTSNPRATTTITDAIAKFGGKTTGRIATKERTLAIVADVPFDAFKLLANELDATEVTRYVEPNTKVQASFTPNDTYWDMQWGPRKIQADYAWNTTVGNSSILVAIVDTGIAYNHADLAANYVAGGYDWVNNDNNPMDDHGHGTHCAGIVAAVINNSLGIAGLAQVRVMAEKALDRDGYGEWDWVANGIINATDAGADIISMSLGGYGSSASVQDAVSYAYENGVLLVAAAGNDNTDARFYPAAYAEVVSVAATGQNDFKASFSNYGSWIELAAPGVDIYSTIPSGYALGSGTSMACPHVAGTAALVWSQFPNASRDWIRMKLRYTTVDLGTTGFDVFYGHGRINASSAVELPPMHDILVASWEKPKFIEPEDSVTFNATIVNLGANDEQNISVQLLINGSLTDSATIDSLPNGTSTTVGLVWSPLSEQTGNVTVYVLPVTGETATENNAVTAIMQVRTAAGFVLFDQTRCQSVDYYGTLVASLAGNGYLVDPFGESELTIELLADYDILVIPNAWWEYAEYEVFAIREFVQNGGGLLVIGDSYPSVYVSITSFAGILWSSYYGWQGDTSDFTSHEIVEGVTAVTCGYPMSKLLANQPAESIVRSSSPSKETMVAVAEVGLGRVACVADDDTIADYGIDQTDNLVLANNIIDWLRARTKYEHELLVRLDTPFYLEPNMNATLNATVCNNGFSNETDVELQLFVNNTLAANTTIVLLENRTQHMMSYEWMPAQVAAYNVTAYVPPKTGENVTANNVKTYFVSVQNPLISPVPGQYSNYTYLIRDASDRLAGVGSWNFTYDYYVEPYKMHVTLDYQVHPAMSIIGSMVVNTMTRFVESGLWAGYWYPGWIETNITVGSAVNLLSEIAYVNSTQMIVVGARAIECWELPLLMYGIPYTFWYDKISGLWIGMRMIGPQGEISDLLLDKTNILIGTLYEHDLGVSLDAPNRLQPNTTVLLNATIYNVGLSNETHVTLEIVINQIVVKSEVFPDIYNGTNFTINYTWTPATEGLYNVTAYAPPVPAENVTINNIKTRMTQIQDIEVALVSDSSELMSLTPMLSEMGVGYDVYNDNMMYLYTENLTLLLKYKAVIFFKDGRYITNSEYAALDSYLRAKGCLLVTGYYCLDGDSLMAEIVRSSTYGNDAGEMDLYVVNETHPIVNGPYGVFPSGYHIEWLSAECSLAEANTARGASTVAELSDGYDRIIATERIPGKVVFWNGVGTSDWTWSIDCEAMFKNIIHWFTFRPEHEIVVSLTAPKFLEPSNTTNLRATIENLGSSNETDVEVQIIINGTVVKSGTAALLPTDGTYTLSHSWTVLDFGTYNVTAYAPPLAGENNTANNAYSKLIPVQIAQRILSYVMYSDYLGSYRNTLTAMELAFGPAYKVTEFWLHTQLASLLPGRDILLVPNQEQASLSTMTSVGSDWSDTLTDFLDLGGTVIICDGGLGAGETYGILTGAGLMSISDVYSRTNNTLYLAEPRDALAAGVSQTFSGPYRTTSYQTLEETAVIDDGTHPVAIHKHVGGGHLVLLGFDYEDYNAASSQLLGNAVALTAYVTISISPDAGGPGSEVLVTGSGATINGSVAIHWDAALQANIMANGTGGFSCLWVVPEDAAAGIHEISALDETSGKSGSAFFKIIYTLLDPSRGPIGAKVTVQGFGFEPHSQASVSYNDMLIGYAAVDISGEFSFTFNVPMSAAETQIVKASDWEGNYAHALFTVIDVTPLDVDVDVGVIHFAGEVAEFYALTALNGERVNVTAFDALLYKPDGTTEILMVQLIATGFYKIPYTIVDSAAGTYALVVAVAIDDETTQAKGTAFKSFLVSSTLAGWNATLVDINADVAAVKTEMGLINLRLGAINATIVSIDGRTAIIDSTLGVILADISTVNAALTALNGTTATIHTDLAEVSTSIDNIGLKVVSMNGTAVTIETALGTLNGTVTSIVNNVASIQTDIGEVQASISDFSGTQEAWIIPQYLILALAAVAAATGLTALLASKVRRRT